MPAAAATSPARLLTPRDHAVLALLSLAVLLPGTFGVSLVDRDEGWYAQVSREMLATGDWLVPHYLGEPWLGKPPLLYWCVSASFALFGMHAWAARLVSVLAMTVAVQLLAMLAAELCNRRVALIAAGSFITAGLPAVVGKMVLTDALLLACCLAATLLLWRIATPARRGPTLSRSALFWFVVGLAVLAKGPAVIMFVGAFTLGVVLYLRRRGPALRSPTFWLTLPVCLAVAAPWYIYIARQAGQAFWGQFVGYEIISRLVSAPHGHTGPPGYYLLVSLAGWLPWTALVPGAVIEAWRVRKADPRRAGVAWLLLIWLGVPWLLLELMPSKLPHYILPCYVPLAILFGRMWDAGVQQPVTKGQRAVLGVWAAVPMVLGGLIIAVGGAWHRAAWSWAMCATGATLLLGFAAVAWMLRRQRLPAAWKSSVAALVAFHAVAGVWLLPALEPHRLSRLVAERANILGAGVAEVVVCGYTEPTMFFYLRSPARVVGAEECARILADTTEPRVIIAREAELRAAGIEPREGPGAAGQGSALRSEVWERTAGFNYVKGRDEVVWVVRAGSPDGGGRSPGPTSSPRPGTGSPSF